MYKLTGTWRVAFEILIISMLLLFLMAPLIIEKIILYKMQGAENITVKKVSVHMLNSGIVFIDFQARDLKINNRMIVSGTVKKVEVKGIPVISILLNRKCVIEGVALWNPNLLFKSRTVEKAAGTSPAINFTGINKLDIYEGNFQLTDSLGGKYSINDLTLDFSPIDFKKGLLASDSPEFSFSSGEVSYQSPDSLYVSKVMEMRGSSDKGLLVFDSVSIVPSYSENEFKSHIKYQSDRFDFTSPKITVALGKELILAEDRYYVKLIHLHAPQIKVFRDKHIARNLKTKYQSLQYYLHNATFNSLVDTIVIDKGYIRYRELAENSDETGEIIFPDADIKVQNLRTGVDTTMEMQLFMQSGFMTSGSISAKLKFPYNSEYFLCEGVLKHLPMRELNKMTGPNAGVVFNKGNVKSLNFNFTGYNTYATGDLNIQFRNLDFTVKDKPGGESENFLSRVKTAALGIFIKKEVKKEEENISLKGVICQSRLKERFLFNYIWKSILSGLQSAMTGKATPVPKSSGKKPPC